MASVHKVALTVDVEDWYHVPSVTGSPFSVYKDVKEFFSKWKGRYDYLSDPTERVLDLLDMYDVKATFLVVADVVNRYPGLVESIAERGHEIGCHGLNHACKIDPKNKKPLMSVNEFVDRTKEAKNILEKFSGQRIVGYRAPNAVVGGWMLEELPNLGFRYDSSVSVNSLYKKTDLDLNGVTTKPYEVVPGLIEYPMAYLDVLGLKIPTSGGPMLRFLGEKIVKQGLEQSLKRGDTVFYFHPIDISREKFPDVGNNRPFYWSIKGKIVENRIKNLLKKLISKDISLDPIIEIITKKNM